MEGGEDGGRGGGLSRKDKQTNKNSIPITRREEREWKAEEGSNSQVACQNQIISKGATPDPRKQTSAGQGFRNISVITETGESWEGQCSSVSGSAKSPETV